MPEESKDISMLETVRELKRRDPFQKFSIVLASGKSYLIENGENLVEMKSEFFYAFPGGERFVFLRHNQIASVEGSNARERTKKK